MRIAPALIIAGAVSACNSSGADEPDYLPAEAVAVTNFTLSPNTKVLANLDSVFFSIDLNHGVIFNADSLPYGTRVDRLVPKITFSSTVTKAEITMTGGATRTGTVNYKTSPNDSIDFTGKVTLTLATENDALSKTYDLRVNVHKMVADSLVWDKNATSILPSITAIPLDQRTVSLDEKTYTLIEESDGSYTMAVTSDRTEGAWTRTTLQLPFKPQVRSMMSAGSSLYILNEEGDLFTSSDGLSWSPCGISWQTAIGAFGDALLGIRAENGRLYHDIYPRPADFNTTEIPADFPTSGLSEFHTFTSEWATDPIGLFVGGSRNGVLSNATWAYDGATWAKISHVPLPAMQGVLLVPYYSYRQTATSLIQTEFSVLLAIGGSLTDGSLNPTVYLSYDNGVNWMKGSSLIQLPAFLPPVSGADALIRTVPMNADLDANWKTRSGNIPPHAVIKRISYEIDGSEISWDCPYIYLFGGKKADGSLNTILWRAVLSRLTFAPIF